MKKQRGKTVTKIWVFIACMVFGMIALLGAVATMICASFGYYQGKSSEQIKNNIYESAYNTDAYLALSAGEEGNYYIDEFDNYEFAILPGDKWSSKELKDSSNYIVSNFSDGFPESYIQKVYAVGDLTTYHIADNVFGDSWDEVGYEKVKKQVDQFVVDDTDTDYHTIYAQIDGKYYCMDASFDETEDGIVYYIDGVAFQESELGTFNSFEIVPDNDVFELDVAEDKSAYATIEISDSTLSEYTVISSSKENVVKGDDYLYEANRLYTYSKSLSVAGPIAFIVGLVFAIIFFVILMSLSGYHKEEVKSSYEIYQAKKIDENLYLQRRGLDKIPMDVNLVFIISIFGVLIAIAVDGVTYGSNLMLYMIIILGLIIIGVFFGLLYSMTLASNFKNKSWWKNTLLAMGFSLFSKWYKKIRGISRESAKSVKMHTRLWIIYGGVAFFEFVGLSFLADSYRFGTIIFIWFIEKIVFAVLLFKLLHQFGEIKATTKEITEGNLAASVNTENMFIDLQEEGDYINSIKNGLDTAIEERMKSEHFQTELITNVSHDIKTPLTSIISYVDLLEKEKIENEKANEYLEVLDRQSKRLKKLLQDLLDASKASTGNVELHMEKVDVGVLLNQVVGEFHEKLGNAGVELKVKTPVTAPCILADSRYLWRVFDNLMNNICKYGAINTRAYINLEVKDAKVILTFLNTSKDELNISTDELLQRFVRGDSSRNTEGSGLGLSIAQSLTELMGGEMKLSVEGDLFKVELSFASC
ncbi:MAG: HAMP domain-containing histidine kinase [Lachnospiraceae bacterium]|nr:HAMP domain-containing histidine kinase [Lachnospiraceae bacterium]